MDQTRPTRSDTRKSPRERLRVGGECRKSMFAIVAETAVGCSSTWSKHPRRPTWPTVTFDATRTVLIRTITGSVFKLGFVSESSTAVTFDVAQLAP